MVDLLLECGKFLDDLLISDFETLLLLDVLFKVTLIDSLLDDLSLRLDELTLKILRYG